MKVIFLKDVKNQGKKDEVKTVKDGYATNYLIKNNLAVKLTEKSLEIVEEEKERKKLKEEEDRKTAQEVKKQLEAITLTFQVKTGKEDKVFGSISPKQIKESLEEKNIIIDKKQIITKEPLTTLGFHEVKIELYKDVIGKIKVSLTK